MKSARNITLLSLLTLCCLIVLGCSKKDDTAPPANPGESVSKAAEKVATDAEKMDVKQLRTAALECRAAIETKMAETDKLAQGLIKSLTTNDSDKKNELNAQMKELSKSQEALVKQLEIYVAKLKEKGGDLSGLE